MHRPQPKEGLKPQRSDLSLLNSLRAFEAAARHQSIKKACDELHVTHASVSRHIRKLESGLECRLFVRYNRKIVLTDDGVLLSRAVAAGFSDILRALLQLKGRQTSERLVISVDPDFAGLWLVPRLAEFNVLMPDVLVEILAEDRPPSSSRPGFHCSVHYAEAGIADESSQLLFRSQLFPVCASSLTQIFPLNSPEDLRHHTFLHDHSVVEWEEYLHGLAATSDLNIRSGTIFSATAHCLDAAARGQGVAIGDDFLAATHLAERRLMRPFGSSVPSKNAFYFAVAEGAASNRSVEAFRAWLLGTIEHQRGVSEIR